ncbi:MAG: family 20 glycosylhydrolase [Gelidibacter sp.]
MNKIILYLIVLGFSCHYGRAQNLEKENYNLMPWPKEIVQTQANFNVNKDVTITLIGDDSQNRVHAAAVNFLRHLSNKTGVFLDHGFPINIMGKQSGIIEIKFDSVSNLTIHSDESYNLSVGLDKITIQSKTDVGALRALATLLQLVTHNASTYFIPGVVINDVPRFVWRGLMIDVARHFQPVDVLKRNLEAMAFVKMNVFHWHLTDDQGFRAEVKSHPLLHQKGSDGLYYTQEQIKDIVAYASNLGIRVVPEFDVPSHATSWLVAYPEIGSKENTTYEIERNSGIFDPTLDPTDPRTYDIIEDVFTEMAALFPDTYFHIGGDENKGKHWNENKKIEAFKKEHGFKTNHELQNYFNVKVLDILKKHDKIMMGWEEILQDDLPKDVVIHSWQGEASLTDAITKGYKTVLSRGYYIDLVKSVKEHYVVDPFPATSHAITEGHLKNILGGETTMWSEMVTPLTIDSRIWPRTAAIAERFWSPQAINDMADMKRRLMVISVELENFGITHLRNKDLILRNLSNNQDISSLRDLSNICEPLQGNKRNIKIKGGSTYKTFSPFTLFADACVPDAPDAVIFNIAVTGYIKDSNPKDHKIVLAFLDKWSKNYTAFSKINTNPKLQGLEGLSKNLTGISLLLLDLLENKKVVPNTLAQLEVHQKALNENYAHTEVVITKALGQLIEKCIADFSKP